MDYSQAFFIFIAALKFADALTLRRAFGISSGLSGFNSALLPVSKGLPHVREILPYLVPLALVFSAVFHIVGAYRRDRIHFGFRALKKVTEGCVLGTLVFISICYFLYEVQYSRLYLALFPGCRGGGPLLERASFQLAWNWFERSADTSNANSVDGRRRAARHVLGQARRAKAISHRMGGQAGTGSFPPAKLAEMPYSGPETNLESRARQPGDRPSDSVTTQRIALANIREFSPSFPTSLSG